MSSNLQARKIRSYVKRTGRMTVGQEKAYQQGMSQYGLTLDANQTFDIETIFSRQAKLNVEIGFGMGESLALMAMNVADENFIGIEVHTPGVGKLLQTILQDEIANIRIVECDALDVFEYAFADNCIDRLQIYFPDPWHKTRHHKRRLINNKFLDLVVPKLKPQGHIHVATDWEPYAQHARNIFSQREDFQNTSIRVDQFSDKPTWRPETKFERRGKKLGHAVFDLLYRKIK